MKKRLSDFTAQSGMVGLNSSRCAYRVQAWESGVDNPERMINKHLTALESWPSFGGPNFVSSLTQAN